MIHNLQKQIIFCFFFILISSTFLIFGNFKINQFNSLKNIKNSYVIRAVSPNISLGRFYSNQDEIKIINELITLSAPEKKIPTIFLWPEGIIPDSYVSEMDIYQDLFINNFSSDDLIIMGLNSIEDSNGENLFFNSMAVFDHKMQLQESYNKVNLVPFGEFIPFKNILGLIGLKTVTNNYQSFSSGKNRAPFNIDKDKIKVSLLPLICYEIIYSGKISKENNYNYIINISEDGWFGRSIGPKQHFSHSIFRSIESGKYIIRSANNGITAIVNPIGIIEQKVEFGSTGYVDFTESKITKSTLFMKYGNIIFFITILIYIFFIFSFNKLEHE